MLYIKTIKPLCLCLILGIAGVSSDALAAGMFKRFKQMHDAYEKVEFDSEEDAGAFSSGKTKIAGYLLKADTDGKAPAVVLRPACNGIIFHKKGIIRPYHMILADILHQQGITILMVDGFSPRDYKNICQEPPNERRISQDIRIKDTLGGLNYLRSRDDIDANKVFLLTYGATGGLRLLNESSDYYKKHGAGFAGAVMFFPQCDGAGNNFSPYAPIQVFVGEEDAWNPPGLCRDLVRSKKGGDVFNLEVYPDTYHAFIKLLPPREVNGPPAVGRVMAGSNPKATKDSYQKTVEFLNSIIKSSN